MDAEYLTALHTGAATGLATRLLAKTKAKAAALLGAGGQADGKLLAMLEVLPLETVYVFSRNPSHAESFCHDQSVRVGFCQLVPASSREVLRNCDVIATATSSSIPVFEDDEIASGVHISGVGSFRPDMSEVPPQTVSRANVFVGQREVACVEAGDLIQPVSQGMLPADFRPTEIGEVLLGEASGRNRNEEVTFFKSVGNAARRPDRDCRVLQSQGCRGRTRCPDISSVTN